MTISSLVYLVSNLILFKSMQESIHIVRYFLQDPISAYHWFTSSQVVLGKAARNDDFFGGFLNICLGYGFALMIGICIRSDKEFCITVTRLRPFLYFNNKTSLLSGVVISFLSFSSDGSISVAFNGDIFKFASLLHQPILSAWIHIFSLFCFCILILYYFLFSGGVSGGHLNPAVTLAMAAIKKLKPIQIPVIFKNYW